MEAFVFPPRFSYRVADLLLCDAFALQNIGKFIDQVFIVVIRKERMHEFDSVLFDDLIHVVGDDLGVRGHDRAVVVIRLLRILYSFIVDARVEDELLSVLRQPLDVPVDDLRRIARCVGRNRIHSQFIDGLAGLRRENDSVAELRPEGKPERIVLIHVQDARDAHFSSGSILCVERFVLEQPFEFILVEIRELTVGRFRFAFSLFAAVSGDQTAAVRELVDGQQAVVLTPFAPRCRCLYFEVVQFISLEKRRFSALVIAPRDKGCAECSHQSGNVRTHDILTQDLLNGAEHGFVQERAALHDDLLPCVLRISELDDLVKGVLDDGIRQSGGDISDRRAFLLGLLDLGVHEDRAPCAQIDRAFCEQRFLRKIRNAHLYRLGIGLDE